MFTNVFVLYLRYHYTKNMSAIECFLITKC